MKDGGCDLLLILGQSVDMYPMNEIMNKLSVECPKVLIDTNSNVSKPIFEDLLKYPERLFIDS